MTHLDKVAKEITPGQVAKTVGLNFYITLALLGGITIYTMSVIEGDVKDNQPSSSLELKVGYYNSNNILDKFYEIEGKKVPVEVDGKNVEEYFK